MLRASEDPANVALQRFNEAVEKARAELGEDTARLQSLHGRLKSLCEANATMQAHVKDPKWDRRLDALRKEAFTMEEQNAQLRDQLDTNEQYMTRLRATRATVEASKEQTKDAAQAAREAYIAEALQVHAAVMAQMEPSQWLVSWQARKGEAERTMEALQQMVQSLRQRVALLRDELVRLGGDTQKVMQDVDTDARTEHAELSRQNEAAVNEEATSEDGDQNTDLTSAAKAGTDEKLTLLQMLSELSALCAQHEAEQQTQQKALTAQRDALRAELTVLCEEVEELDVREQACQQTLHHAVHEAAATTSAQDARCRICQADIFTSFL